MVFYVLLFIFCVKWRSNYNIKKKHIDEKKRNKQENGLVERCYEKDKS